MSTMSTNPVDSALNFMPDAAPAKASRHADGPFARLVSLLEAVSSGLAAMHRYEGLRARGVSPSDAAARVHHEFYGD